MHFDLIVIGAGLAGLMAAKTACEAGARVLVVGKGTGAVCLFTQGIDLLGVIPRELPMEEGIRQWIEANPHHPYARVTWPGVQGALSSFLALFPGPYTFEAIGEGNCLVPTGAGTYRPTYLVPTTMCAGIAFPRRSAATGGADIDKPRHRAAKSPPNSRKAPGSAGLSAEKTQALHHQRAEARHHP